jgi:hypothetical protein
MAGADRRDQRAAQRSGGSANSGSQSVRSSDTAACRLRAGDPAAHRFAERRDPPAPFSGCCWAPGGRSGFSIVTARSALALLAAAPRCHAFIVGSAHEGRPDVCAWALHGAVVMPGRSTARSLVPRP